MCRCIDTINEAYITKGYNTELDLPIVLTADLSNIKPLRVKIATRKIDRNKRDGPMTLLARYCPFCGLEYPDDDP